ncbi:hypothetical protein ACWD5V_18830 [Streptomyces sp. NPDC002523]
MQETVLSPWPETFPWAVVITVIIVVIGLRPNLTTVEACSALLFAVAETHRRLTR